MMIWGVVAAYLVIYPLLSGLFPTLWWAHLVAVGLLGVCAWPTLREKEQVSLGPPLVVCLLALFSMAVAIATSVGVYPWIEMWRAGLTGLTHVLFFLLILSLGPSAEENGDVVSRVLGVILMGVLVGQTILVWGGWEIAPPVLIESVKSGGGDPWRPMGSLGNPNTLGAVVGATVAGLAAVFRWRWAALILLVPFLWLLVESQSRGAMASTLIVLTVFGLRHRVGLTLALLCIGVLSLAMIPNPFWDRMTALPTGHTYSRPMIWSIALVVVAAHPLGLGPAMYRYIFPLYGEVSEHPWLLHQRHSIGLTHNALLTLWAEWGWLAGGAVCCLLVWAAIRLWRRGRADPLLQATTLVASVLFVQSLVDGLEQNPIPFTLFLFCLAIALKRASPTLGNPSLSGRHVGGVVAVISVLLLFVGLKEPIAQEPVRLAKEVWTTWRSQEVNDSQRIDTAEVRRLMERAQEARANNPAVHLLRFDFEFAAYREARATGASDDTCGALARAATAAVRRARQLSPRDPEPVAKEARLLRRLYHDSGKAQGVLETYLVTMEELLERDPLDVDSRWALAREALRSERTPFAQRQLDDLFALEPDHAEAWWILGRTREVESDLEAALYAYVRAEEAVLNCRIKLEVANPRSEAFYQRMLDQTDLGDIRRRIAHLRQALYF